VPDGFLIAAGMFSHVSCNFHTAIRSTPFQGMIFYLIYCTANIRNIRLCNIKIQGGDGVEFSRPKSSSQGLRDGNITYARQPAVAWIMFAPQPCSPMANPSLVEWLCL
jgi:hypothetical protein